MVNKKNIEIERSMSRTAFKNLLSRIQEGLEEGLPARIMVKGSRVTVPADAKLSVEFEVDGDEAELELQFSWKVKPVKPTKRKAR